MLKVAKVARATAIQRAGRAGRTRPGVCLRLYTRADHDARPAFDRPEALREDLAETVLDLAATGVTDPAAFPWFEAPPAVAPPEPPRVAVISNPDWQRKPSNEDIADMLSYFQGASTIYKNRPNGR
jgi:hypothetical protein